MPQPGQLIVQTNRMRKTYAPYWKVGAVQPTKKQKLFYSSQLFQPAAKIVTACVPCEGEGFVHELVIREAVEKTVSRYSMLLK